MDHLPLTPEHLLVRAAARICAIPLAPVVEILRPLPLRPVAGAPEFLLGLSVVRGAALPVIDLACLLDGRGGRLHARWVTLRISERRLAVAAEEFLGLRSLPVAELGTLPPLLGGAPSRVIQSLGSLDAELLVVLQTGRLVPDELWNALASREAG